LVVTRVRCFRLGAAVGLAMLLASCNVNTRVDVTLRDDGSGSLRSTITLDADAVQQLGGAAGLSKTIPLDDLRKSGWTITSWARGTAGSEAISLTHGFADEAELAQRIIDLAGPHGVLQSPKVTHQRGWFANNDALDIVVDVRSPSVDIVGDKPLAARLRAAGTDPAKLEALLAVQLKTALHVSVALHLPDGHSKSYDAATGSVQTLSLHHGGLAWDHVVKFGIGAALALLAVLFFLAAGVGARKNRRRRAQRIERNPQERSPLM
jgi:hypothetical protein